MSARQPDPWAGQLTLAPGAVFYAGPGGQAGQHRHLAVQIIRTHGEPFTVTLDHERVTASAALIPSGVSHSFEAESPIDLALVEPEGPVGSHLQEIALQMSGQDLAGRIPTESIDPFLVLASLDPEDSQRSSTPTVLSPVVEAAVAFVERSLEGRPRLRDAAAEVHISPSRLTHLFTTEVGIPFRNYVLWARLRRMVLLVGEGDNLTQAAHGSGFSDSAHLSRVFRDHFGLPPSALLHMELSGNWHLPS